MSALLPRALVHRGRVTAGGLWIDRALVGELEARRRVLEVLEHAATVLELGGGYLVLFVTPVRLDADCCPGTPVIEHDGCWLATPLRSDERARLDPSPRGLVRARGGRLDVLSLDRAVPVDVASWLDLSGWDVLPVESLGAARPVATAPTPAVGTQGVVELSSMLGEQLPRPDPQRAEILAALAETTSGRAVPGFARGGLLGALESWWAALIGSPGQALPPGSVDPGAAVGAGSRSAATSARPRSGLLRQWITKLVMRSQLARVIGRRQALYLQHTLRLLEEQDWDEALRRAIPFSSLPGAPEPPALSVPSPRAELVLRAVRSSELSASITLGDELHERFKELYRKAARSLEEQDRIDEAAYVLFELLADDEEGVAMLERHERYDLAARMAEGRGLAPGLVIRLWFLANEPAKAILVARRTGAFADAVERLQRTRPPLADRLRLLWADRLASAGDYAAAVDAVWPVLAGRALARAWIDRAIAFGGPVACRMLPRKLAAWPDDPAVRTEVAGSVQALLDEPSDDALPLRHELGRAWLDHEAATPTWTELGRALARQLMVDAHVTGQLDAPKRLVAKLDDPVLRADASRSGVPRPVAARRSERSPIFEPHERGLTPVHDAVLLPNGQLLLALGDAGLRLVDARGRTLRAYEHPASRLVLADHGLRALASIERGKTWSLRRLDLESGRAERWCDARMLHAATSYDGAGWFVVDERAEAVILVDAQAPGLEALWRVSIPARQGRWEGSDAHQAIVALERSPTHLSLVVEQARLQPAAPPKLALEIWTYALTAGGPVLRRRHEVETTIDLQTHLEGSPSLAASVDPRGWLAVAATEHPSKPARIVASAPNDVVVEGRLPGLVALRARAAHVDCLQRQPEGIVLHRLDYASLVPPPTPALELRGGRTAHLHPLPGEQTLVVDDLGRVIRLDADGRVASHWLV